MGDYRLLRRRSWRSDTNASAPPSRASICAKLTPSTPPRTALGTGDSVGAGQYVTPIDPVIQSVKPKLRLLLHLAVELLSQRGELLRQLDGLHVGRGPHVDRSPKPRLFRSGPFGQAALLSSHSARSRQGPLAPRALPRFPATMGLSDSRHGPLTVMGSHQRLAAWPPPRRVSQVPRCDFPRAPSPITPGCPAVAHARCFPAGGRLHLLRQASHIQFTCDEAETSSLVLGLTRSQSGSGHCLRPCLYNRGPARFPCLVTLTWGAAAT